MGGPNLGRFLTLGAAAPAELMPTWWPLLRAARWLGVPPWELARQAAAWTQWANEAASAEIRAENQSDRHPV